MTIPFRGAWVLFLGLAIASCSGPENAPSTPTAASVPTQAPTPAVPPVSSSSSLAVLASPEARIFNVTAADAAPAGRGPCEFDAASGQFVCPTQSRDGITFTTRFTLYDAKGTALAKFGPDVSSIRTETTADGTTTRDNATVTLSRSGVMVNSGLGRDAKTHTLNGTERGTVVTTATANDGTKVTTNTSIDDTTKNLVVPARIEDRATAYPLSGVRVHSTVTSGAPRGTLSVRRQETFDGTSIVRIELTVNGVTQQCTYDLAAKTSTCQR